MGLKLIKKLCSLNKRSLEIMLIKYLKELGYTIKFSNEYIIAEGQLPVCLLAHMDTVFAQPPKNFFYDKEKTTLWSPDGLGADDRAGIYSIINILEEGYRPSLIFTDGEERGGIGASALIQKFPDCPFSECKALIQLDRQGSKDAVFYGCDNPDFTKLIVSYGFEEEWGTFTDISIIAPQWKIAAVNLSVGYFNEHQRIEFLNLVHCHSTINKVKEMLKDCTEWLSYSYIPAKIEPMFVGHDHCYFCNKPLHSAQGHLVSDYIGNQEYVWSLCDQCYNDYKDYLLDGTYTDNMAEDITD